MNPRRVFVLWFGLIVLYTATTRSDKVAGLLGLSSAALRRISDPTVPLVPDLAGGTTSSTYSPAAAGYNNSSSAIYGSAGGQYVGSTFVPNPQPTDPRGGPKDSKS